MTRYLVVFAFGLAGCAEGTFSGWDGAFGAAPAAAVEVAETGDPADETPPEELPETLDPTPPPPPPPSADTAEEFDTTSAEDRAEALAVEPEVVNASASGGAGPLGTTLATLGSPADPGIWLKTPLVSGLTEGRITYQGTSINIELRPSGGEAGSGSQISLPAMRLIGAPLTDVIELTVFAN